jgi:polyphosphate glucokinase
MATADKPVTGPVTLSLDVGGTGIKGDTLDAKGAITSERVRIATTYPMPPEALLAVFKQIALRLPKLDRVSVGFPGVVRNGLTLSAPHFITKGGDGTPVIPALEDAWNRFDLTTATATALGKPTRVGNDAEVQGLAVVKGKGLEVVLTLGTGVGSAVFLDGKLAPHLELAHHPIHKSRTYNEDLGESARKQIGEKRWSKRVVRMVGVVRVLLLFDHLYIGGGNAIAIKVDLGKDVTLVDNDAGILGGIKLWAEPRGTARTPR